MPFNVTYWSGSLDAWPLQDLFATTCLGTCNQRARYLACTLNDFFGSFCSTTSDPATDVSMEYQQEPFHALTNPVREDRARFAITLSQRARVLIVIYDIAGRRVRTLSDATLAAGPHEIAWDRRGDDGGLVKPGVYYVLARLPGAHSTVSRSLVLLR